MTKMTRWFPAETKPTRRGVYQRRLAGNAKVFSKWTGAWWCLVHPTADGAARMRSTSRYQGGQWRGLAADPFGVTACPHGVPHRWPCEKCDSTPGVVIPSAAQPSERSDG